FDELESRERILMVSVESRRDVDDLGPVLFQSGEPMVAHRIAEPVAAGPGGKRDVDHVRGRIVEPAVWVQWMLESSYHEHARVAGENVFGAVAVVDIEIDDGDPLDTVGGHRVRRADRDVVEQAETHRPVALGVVARRPNRAERGLAFAPHDKVGREYHR